MGYLVNTKVNLVLIIVEFIKCLPKLQISFINGKNDDGDCPICMDSINDKFTWICGICKYKFCLECMDKIKSIMSCCPCCRTGVDFWGSCSKEEYQLGVLLGNMKI